MFGKNKIEINAILDKDVEILLRATDQLDDFNNGNIHCASCNTIMTVANIGIMVPVKENEKIKIKFYCEKIDCSEKYNSTNGN